MSDLGRLDPKKTMEIFALEMAKKQNEIDLLNIALNAARQEIVRLGEEVKGKDAALKPFALAFDNPTEASRMISLHDLRIAAEALR